MSRKRIIAIISIILFIATALTGILIPADWLYKTPQTPHKLQFYGKEVMHIINWTCANIDHVIDPSTTYEIEIFFTADLNLKTSDPISAGNTVDYSILIHDIHAYVPSNETALRYKALSAYGRCCAYLTNSVYVDNGTYAVLPLIRTDWKNDIGDLMINYSASGKIKFITSGMTYLRLDVPYQPSFISANVNQSNPFSPTLTPVIDVQPASDSLNFNQFTIKLAISLSSFGWLALPSVVETILTKKNPDE